MNTFPDYVLRIETLDEASKDDNDFRQALKKQEWIVLAAGDAAQNGKLKVLCANLAELLRTDDHPADHVRLAAQQVVKLWKDVSRPDTSDGTEWWLGLVASVVTLIAFVLGDKGLIPLFKALYPPSATLAAPRSNEWNVTPFEYGVVYFHVLVLVLLLALQFTKYGKPHGIDQPDPGSPEAALARFRRGWLGIWTCWLASYSWLSIGYSQHWYKTDWMWAIADLFNAANGFCFFYCFLVLDEPSVPTGSVYPRRFKNHVTFVLVMGVIVVFLSIAGRLAHDSPLKHSGPFLLSCYTGLGMAYLVGRFDSHHMEVHRLMLAPLYFYVMIQLTWVILTFSDELLKFDSTVRTVILVAALLLKVLVYVVMTHWLMTGTLLKYLEGMGNFFKNKPLDVLRRGTAAGG